MILLVKNIPHKTSKRNLDLFIMIFQRFFFTFFYFDNFYFFNFSYWLQKCSLNWLLYSQSFNKSD